MTSRNPLQRLVLHSTLGAFAVKGLAAAAGLLMNILLARVLTTADYGVVALGLSWLTIAATVACFGSDTVSVRIVAQAHAQDDAATIVGVTGWGRRLTWLLGTGIGIGSGLAIWFVFADYSVEQRIALSVIVLATPALAFALNRASVLRGFKKAVSAAVVEMLLRPVLILLLVLGLAWVAQSSPGVLAVAALVWLAHLLMSGAGMAATRPLIHTPTGRHSAQAVHSISQRAEWLAIAKPIAFMNVMGVLIGNVDTVLVGYFASAESAGVYRASAQLASLVSFGLAASNGIVAPLIAQLYAQRRRQELARVLRLSVALVSVIGVGGALCMAALGKWTLGLFGEEYVAGYTALLILLAAQAVNALCGPTGFAMSMTGHQSAAARIFAASAAISVVLNLLLIPPFGIVGAALANLIGLAVWNLVILFFLKRRLGLDPSILAWVVSPRAAAQA